MVSRTPTHTGPRGSRWTTTLALASPTTDPAIGHVAGWARSPSPRAATVVAVAGGPVVGAGVAGGSVVTAAVVATVLGGTVGGRVPGSSLGRIGASDVDAPLPGCDDAHAPSTTAPASATASAIAAVTGIRAAARRLGPRCDGLVTDRAVGTGPVWPLRHVGGRHSGDYGAAVTHVLSGIDPGDPAGISVERVTAWLAENIAGATSPFTFTLIAGGHSNLTYRVTGADGAAYVLRRPPLGHLLASAHDMGREHRIIAALAGTAVPVAPALGLCDDPSVNGAPFYLMAFVDGNVVRDRATADATLTVARRAVAGRSLADTLAAIHADDPTAVGLGDLGRHEGYVARQLKRWYGQWNAQKTRELPAVDRVHAALATHIPSQVGATIVHGDYRLDNCMLGTDATVAAVLDWEICTLGDPMADVGLLMVYWTGPDDTPSAWEGQASTAPGFPNRADLLQRYAAASGRDVDGVGYFVAFAYWKLACILEGVYARYLGGALGARDRDELAPFERQVTAAAAMAGDELARLGLL